MKTPKTLYATTRQIYHPELTVCPQCDKPLVLANYLLWDKTIQTLDGVLSVASRPAACKNPACPVFSQPLRSAAAQAIALPHSTYGLDVLVRIGWLRYSRRCTFREIHTDLSNYIQISESHIRHLYQQCFLPLLACHEQQQQHLLDQAVQQYGGLILALDGLAPEAGEPQLWCIRELLTGLVLRSGWFSRQDQATFEAFLQPLTQMRWPIRALVGDKQCGLFAAVSTMFPSIPYQLCQSHYLHNLAEPLAEVDSAMTVSIRKIVRHNLGSLLLAEASCEPNKPVLLTSTGLLVPASVSPSSSNHPIDGTTAPIDSTTAETNKAICETQINEPDVSCQAQEVITALIRRTRYLLTLKGRPPLRLSGLEVVAGLQQVREVSKVLLAHRYEQRLNNLAQGLEQALEQIESSLAVLQKGADWLNGIASVLRADKEPNQSGEQVAEQLRAYLAEIEQQDCTEPQQRFCRHLQRVSRRYWSGLFHCYDQDVIPRTNNEMESHFRDTQRRLLRTSGQRAQYLRTLHRFGAWELLSLPESESAILAAFRQITPTALTAERQRLRNHQKRFRLHTRSVQHSIKQLERLQQQWLTLPGTSTG